MQPARSLAHTAALPGDVRLAERAGEPAGAARARAGAAPRRGSGGRGGRVGRGSAPGATAKFDLSLFAVRAGRADRGWRDLRHGAVRAGDDGAPRGVPARRVLEAMVADDRQGVDALALLPERRAARRWWTSGTATDAAYPAGSSRPRALRGAGGAHARRGGGGVRGRAPHLRGAEPAGEPAGAPPRRPRRGRRRRAWRSALERGAGADRGHAGRAQGRRGVRAAGPGLPGRAAALHAGRQRGGRAAVPAGCWARALDDALSAGRTRAVSAGRGGRSDRARAGREPRRGGRAGTASAT